MSDARIEGYARALFEVARADGTLDEVEDELFRFARSYESSDALRNAITDEHVPVEKRQAIVDSLVQRASSAKQLDVAEVRTAVALTDDQQARLKAALENATGKQLNLKSVVDPSVVGGIVATVGDIVIDDSVRTRIDQLKSRL